LGSNKENDGAPAPQKIGPMTLGCLKIESALHFAGGKSKSAARRRSRLLPLPCGERVGVRGFRPIRVCNPSPDRFAVDLSLWER